MHVQSVKSMRIFVQAKTRTYRIKNRSKLFMLSQSCAYVQDWLIINSSRISSNRFSSRTSFIDKFTFNLFPVARVHTLRNKVVWLTLTRRSIKNTPRLNVYNLAIFEKSLFIKFKYCSRATSYHIKFNPPPPPPGCRTAAIGQNISTRNTLSK